MSQYAANLTSPYGKSGLDAYAQDQLEVAGSGFFINDDRKKQAIHDRMRDLQEDWMRMTPGERERYERMASEENRMFGLEYGPPAGGYAGPTGFSGGGGRQFVDPFGARYAERDNLNPNITLGEGNTRNFNTGGGIQATRKDGKVYMTNRKAREDGSGDTGRISTSQGKQASTQPKETYKGEAEAKRQWNEIYGGQVMDETLPVEPPRSQAQPQGQPQPQQPYESPQSPAQSQPTNAGDDTESNYHTPAGAWREFKRQVIDEGIVPLFNQSPERDGRRHSNTRYSGPKASAFNPIPGSPGSMQHGLRMATSGRSQRPITLDDIFRT